jgi:hypothetical protein
MKSKWLLIGTTLIFILAFMALQVNAQVNVNKVKEQAQQGAKIVKPPVDKPAEQAVKPTTAPLIQSGKTWYVSMTNGNNKNDGSKGSPFKNIDKAIKECAAGDKIMIAGGTYSGTFNVGFLESDKPLKLYGSYDEGFTKQDIVKHPTVFQPDNKSAAASRKALLRFTKDVAGTVIDHIVWDMGERNAYSNKEGFVKDVEGGRLLMPTEGNPNGNSTVTEPCIQFVSATTGGDVTIQNCVFVNGASFGVQAGHRSGTFRIINNVFVANRMAAIEIFGTCSGSNQKKDMVSCGDVEIAYNTILFSWSRLKDFLDMGYGVRIMTKATYNIHHNIIGANIMGGIDNTRFSKDEYVKIDHNIMFGNKGGDLEYSPASNTRLQLTVDQFGDLEFASVNGNKGDAPPMVVNQPYLKGFYGARYTENLNYDPNSASNQWARALGLNQQGTMTSTVSMYANKYPWKESLSLFGAMKGYGAQLP